jgi:hypothetical protein
MAAFAQPTLDLQAPVARRRRLTPRPLAAIPATSVEPERGEPQARARVGGFDNAALLGRAVAASFDEIEALEVGTDVAPRPGYRAGDVVLVDWSGGAAGAVRARRVESGSAWVAENEDAEGAGAVFAVIRQVV